MVSSGVCIFSIIIFFNKKLGTCSGNWDKHCYSFFFFKFFLAVPGLHCCSWAFSSSVNGGYSLVEVRRLLIEMASLVEHGGFSSCGSPA